MIKNILSNVSITNHYPDQVLVTPITAVRFGKGPFAFFKSLYIQLTRYTGILVFNPSFFWILKSALFKLFSLGKIRIFYFDMLLHRPYSLKDSLKAFVVKIFLKLVDRFIFLHKDISGYSKYYGIPKSKSVYIPFKANNFDKISKYPIEDYGYLLSCGASYRDYKLLAEALKLYPCPTKIVLPKNSLADYHHSIIDETSFGDTVEIIRHDFNPDSWYALLSKCCVVALPIRADVIQCAGISVYLEAMAFGKPVIITEGAATRGMLTDEVAALCPVGDATAFAAAIKKIMTDSAYRSTIALAGRRYALSLGGEDRLVKDILGVLKND